MAKILYVTGTPFDHPKHGERLRYWSIATVLQRLGHEVSSYSMEGGSLPLVGISLEYKESTDFERTHRRVRFSSDDHWEAGGAWLKCHKVDMVILTHPIASDWILMTRKLGIYTVIDAHNFELGLQMRWSTKRSWRSHLAIAFGERSYFPKADRVWVTSERDAESYQRTHHLQSITVIPNVVSLPSLSWTKTNPNVLFVGTYVSRPNREAAKFLAFKVAPILKNRMPEAKIVLVGREPPPWLNHSSSDNIVVVGEVDDLDGYYSDARVVAVPLFHGSGTNLKLVEAMAHGKAIVASSRSAKGLALPPDTVVTARLTGEAFASAVISLLDDNEHARRLGFKARQVAESRYSLTVLEKKIAAELLRAGLQN